MTTEEVRKRAEAHWDGYVGPMMEAMMKAAIEMSRFHYISSHIHGAKHAEEDAKAVARAAFMNEAAA